MSGLAQFVEIAQAPGVVIQISSLAYGTKLIDWFTGNQTDAGSLTIYNPDLSVYRVLNYPAPPDGMQWSSLGYVTETLFDTDESNIEFFMSATAIGDWSEGIFIFREDGEQLFAQNPGSMFSIAGMGYSGAPIFTSGGQTYMVVHGMGSTGPSRIFTLPGTLPCMDCFGSPSNLQLGGFTEPGSRSDILLFPNPAARSVTIALGGSQADAIAVLDAAGQLVRTERIGGRQRVELSTTGLAQGRYVVLVQRAGLRLVSLPLVIER
jgi:hypothetical protein